MTLQCRALFRKASAAVINAGRCCSPPSIPAAFLEIIAALSCAKSAVPVQQIPTEQSFYATQHVGVECSFAAKKIPSTTHRQWKRLQSVYSIITAVKSLRQGVVQTTRYPPRGSVKIGALDLDDSSSNLDTSSNKANVALVSLSRSSM